MYQVPGLSGGHEEILTTLSRNNMNFGAETHVRFAGISLGCGINWALFEELAVYGQPRSCKYELVDAIRVRSGWE